MKSTIENAIRFYGDMLELIRNEKEFLRTGKRPFGGIAHLRRIAMARNKREGISWKATLNSLDILIRHINGDYGMPGFNEPVEIFMRAAFADLFQADDSVATQTFYDLFQECRGKLVVTGQFVSARMLKVNRDGSGIAIVYTSNAERFQEFVERSNRIVLESSPSDALSAKQA